MTYSYFLCSYTRSKSFDRPFVFSSKANENLLASTDNRDENNLNIFIIESSFLVSFGSVIKYFANQKAKHQLLKLK